MTVTVRPVPKRTYQNGIRPFRPVVPSNNIRPYTLKTWRPPVPEPLPPAPLLGPKELLLLGIGVLAQLWGRLGSRPSTAPSTSPALGTKQEDIPQPSGNGVFDVVVWYNLRGITSSGQCANTPGNSCVLSGSQRFYNAVSNAASLYWTVTPGTSNPTGPWTGQPSNYMLMRGFNNNLWFSNTANGFSTDYWTGDEPVFQAVLPNTQPQFPTPLPEGFEPEPVPVVPLTPTKAPPQVTPYIPGVPVPPAPATPDPEVQPSVVPTTPGPKAPPAVRPASPRPTAPRQVPGATPTRDGALVPQAPATPTATQADAHFPLPGAGPVTGNGPRPTPEGIAQELGRIEQKLERLTNPLYDQPNQPDDRLKWLRDNIGNIIDFFQSINAGGSYTLSSPCVLDANGDRIVYEVEYEGALQSFGVLQNKIDALAELLQVHKDLKQPNCTQKGTGQPVQVNFIQVE